ncbi:MAG: hypothetical protein COT14_03895 [Candidatus Diapherotrites archaeon CG08_land_8_20_14_0_20_30_16]|nr:MAG: hypothetical protein COT14_03895 [Candidatus Diapherotrites archaeon CG08_land_8_20_14_0_20_30_16]
MPLIYIHLIFDVLLIGFIFVFDKELRNQFLKNKLVLLWLSLVVFGSNIIDIDHLLANPIYDPNRCGINFHPLHSWYFMPVWVLGMLFRNKYIRYFCLAVLLHLWLDYMGCIGLL